ncbi:helix-turn-helix domain-containing protein [Thalassiella azotivora]
MDSHGSRRTGRAPLPDGPAATVDAREQPPLTLEELARATGMTVRNVRAYQARGLLPAPERAGRRSLYGREHVARLRLVQALAAQGLTLRVIADLVARGTADEELARLAREDLTQGFGSTGSVPVDSADMARFSREQPEALQVLVESELLERRDGAYVGNAVAMGLTSAIAARGGDYVTCARVGAIASRAGRACRDELADLVEGCLEPLADDPEAQEELRRLAVQLASVAFSDALSRRLLGRDEVSAPGR